LLGHDLGVVHAWHLAGLLRERAKALVTINGLPIAQFVARWRRPKQWLKSWYVFLFQVPVVPEVVFSAGGAGIFRRLSYRVGGLSKAQRPALGGGDVPAPGPDGPGVADGRVGRLGKLGDLVDRMQGESRRAVLGPMLQYRAFFRSVPQQLEVGTPRLECPVLSLWGETDPFLVPPTYDELEGVARRLTIRIIAGGHWLHREKPDEVNRVLDKFFSEAVGG
jgi:pimeloyl-ACP methyl ester carboxylesterase